MSDTTGTDTSRRAGTGPTGWHVLLLASLDRSRERFARALDGVSAEQASARPVDELAPRIDSLAWLAWHTAREIDLQVSALSGSEPLWTAADFVGRFALPLPTDTEDWHHTPAESAQVTVTDTTLLDDYLDAAYALVREYVEGLTEADLDEAVDEWQNQPVTLGVRLSSVIDDAAQHAGAAVSARRLLGLPG